MPPMGGMAAGGNSALSRGFAVVSTDTGHTGQDASFLREQQAATSEILGINASTLYRKLIAYGVEKPGTRSEEEALRDDGPDESQAHAA